ncbi:hypothetical protein AB6A40_000552 [Gnathostoma spinigerum]|uniref:Uncharacterized protein n=1 Tax=Gnathostoma spinigerum TaxID=75299 RepID=A0ABD6EAR2_9BILA
MVVPIDKKMPNKTERRSIIITVIPRSTFGIRVLPSFGTSQCFDGVADSDSFEPFHSRSHPRIRSVKEFFLSRSDSRVHSVKESFLSRSHSRVHSVKESFLSRSHSRVRFAKESFISRSHSRVRSRKESFLSRSDSRVGSVKMLIITTVSVYIYERLFHGVCPPKRLSFIVCVWRSFSTRTR